MGVSQTGAGARRELGGGIEGATESAVRRGVSRRTQPLGEDRQFTKAGFAKKSGPESGGRNERR